MAAEDTSQQQAQAEDHQAHQEENLQMNCWKQTSEINIKCRIRMRHEFEPIEV